MEGQETHKVHKRNRISFVCVSCRQRKIKCDRGKPMCNKCLELGIPCVYDHEKGVKSSKQINDQETILFLQKELHYWKTKAHFLDKSKIYGEYNNENLAQSSFFRTSDTKHSHNEIMIYFDSWYTSITIHNHIKFYQKPFSLLVLIQKDIFFGSLIGSAYGYTILSSQNNNSQYTDSNLLSSNEKPVQKFLEEFIKRTALRKKKMAICIDPVINLINDCIVEDIFDLDSTYITNLLNKIEEVLPDCVSVKFYLVHFFECIYPMHPYIDIVSFYSILKNILVENDSLSINENKFRRYKIIIKSENIRVTIEILSLFLLILCLSYSSLELKMDFDLTSKAANLGIFSENKIRTDLLISHLKSCILLLNITKFPNENIVCLLLYLKTLETLRPDNGNNFCMQDLLIKLSLSNEIALTIGLQNDPNFYTQFHRDYKTDNYLNNYRRKLWLSLIQANIIELLPNGGYYNIITSDHLKNNISYNDYLSYVSSDLNSDNIFEFSIHESLYKDYQLFTILNELIYNSTYTAHPFPLSKIETLCSNVEKTLNFLFPLAELSSNVNNICIDMVENVTENGIYIDITKIRNCKIFLNNLHCKIALLNITWNFCIYFEIKQKEAPFKYSEYVKKFLFTSYKHCFELVKLVKKYLSGELDTFIPFAYRYSIDIYVQKIMIRVSFFLLRNILQYSITIERFDETVDSHFLYSSKKVFSDTMDDFKINLLRGIKNCMHNMLKTIVESSKISLNKRYFSSFKEIGLLEYFLHLIELGKLVEAAYRIWNFQINGIEISTKIQNIFFFTLGINLKDSKIIKDSMNSINILDYFEVSFFETVNDLIASLELLCHNIPTCDSYSSADFLNGTFGPITDGASVELINNDVLNFFKLFDVDEFNV